MLLEPEFKKPTEALMSAHPLYLLVFVTFLLVIGFLVWSKISTKRSLETGGHTSGLGGPNDPLSGHVHLNPDEDNT
jgi:hypothetical protein